MAIKIKTEKPSIPVEIGNLSFDFDISDESIASFRKNAATIREELASLKVDENEDKALEQTKDVLRRGFELALGKGSFDKIYELSPSVVICMNYFVLVVEGIEQELSKMGLSQSQKEKAKKYLAQKKK